MRRVWLPRHVEERLRTEREAAEERQRLERMVTEIEQVKPVVPNRRERRAAAKRQRAARRRNRR